MGEIMKYILIILSIVISIFIISNTLYYYDFFNYLTITCINQLLSMIIYLVLSLINIKIAKNKALYSAFFFAILLLIVYILIKPINLTTIFFISKLLIFILLPFYYKHNLNAHKLKQLQPFL